MKVCGMLWTSWTLPAMEIQLLLIKSQSTSEVNQLHNFRTCLVRIGQKHNLSPCGKYMVIFRHISHPCQLEARLPIGIPNCDPSFKLQAYTLQTLLHLHGATVQIQLVPTWKRRYRRLVEASSRGFMEKTWVGSISYLAHQNGKCWRGCLILSMPLDKA